MVHEPPAPPPETARTAAEAYWSEVETLGIHHLVRMADGRDFVGVTAAGDYIRVPDPPTHDYALRLALLKLTARCHKWYH